MFLAGGQVFSTALGLIHVSIVGRTLGPSDYGIYYIIFSMTAFALVVIDWGQSAYVVREIARGRWQQASFLASAAVVRVVIVLLAILASIALTVIMGYPGIVVWLTPIALFVGLPAILASLLGYFFRGRNRMELDTASSLLGRFVSVAAIFVALSMGGGVVAAVLMPALGGIASFVFSFALARRLGAKLAMPDLITIREATSAGSAIVVMSLSISVQPLLEVMLLSRLTNAEVVGWYGAAQGIIGFLIAPATILATASFPELSRVAHSTTDLRQVLSASARLLLTASALGLCGTFCFADVAVTMIYGPGHFDPAANILKVFAPIFPLFFLNFLLGNAVLAMGKSVSIAIAKIVAIAIALVLSFFLIGFFQNHYGNGAIGAMVAFCISEVVVTIAIVGMLPRGAVDRQVWMYLAQAYVVGIGVLILVHYLAGGQPLWLFGPSVIGLFFVFAFCVRLIKVGDIRAGFSLVNSIVFRRPREKF